MKYVLNFTNTKFVQCYKFILLCLLLVMVVKFKLSK